MAMRALLHRCSSWRSTIQHRPSRWTPIAPHQPSPSISVSELLRSPFSPSHLSSIARPYPICFHRTTVRVLEDLKSGSILFGGRELVGDSLALSKSLEQRRGLSKLKNYKMKSYSSYKERFKLLADGTYKRWRSGTRHNAHSKTPKQRRQLRRPSVAPLALAKVMKKLHFVR